MSSHNALFGSKPIVPVAISPFLTISFSYVAKPLLLRNLSPNGSIQ